MRRIRELPAHDRPRARIQHAGGPALNDTELLAIILGGGIGGMSALDIAGDLLAEHRTWGAIQKLGFEALAGRRGIGQAKAAQITAALEIGRRLLLSTPEDRLQIRSPADVAQLLMVEMGHLDQEQLRVVCLNTKSRVQKICTVYVGSLNSSLVRIGELYKEAIRLNSAAIILAHNHPSSDPTPSPEDMLVTRQAIEAGKLLDIECLDHLVVCQGRFVSMRERGLAFGG